MSLEEAVEKVRRTTDGVRENHARALDRRTRTRKTATSTRRAQEILQACAERVQAKAHKQIVAVVTRCLRAVFGTTGPNAYEFRIDFLRKRGKTEADMYFVKNGEREDPRDGVPGGVLDVAAFALRVAEVLMQRPPVRRLLILDEPFKFPSLRRNYRERVKDLVTALAEELDFQFIIVTHDPVFEVGKVIDLGGKE